MKKIIALFLVLLLVASIGLSAYAETTDKKKFDYTVFEKFPNYEYDKFEDTWYYYEAYVKEYSDATVVIGIDVKGNTTAVQESTLYIKVLDTNGKPADAVKRVDFLIDDVKYTYEKLMETETSSGVILGEQGKALVEAIANSKKISIKITQQYNSATIDLEQDKVNSTLKVICQALIDNNVWDYREDDFFASLCESMFPLTIKK